MTDEEIDQTLALFEGVWNALDAKPVVSLAVAFCATYKRPPPLWVVKAVACLVSPKAKQNDRDFARWQAVENVRTEGVKGDAVYAEANKHLSASGYAADKETIRRSCKRVRKAFPKKG